MENLEYISLSTGCQVKIESDTLEGVFELSLRAMNNLLKKDFCQENDHLKLKHPIDLYSIDRESLLIEFLSEVLNYSLSENTIFCQLEIDELSERSFTASITGRPVDLFEKEIKMVYYNHIGLVKNQNGRWETNIIFDF